MRNQRFGELLDEGISSVAKRQRKTMSAVEEDLAEISGYSVHTVQNWRRGNVPPDDDFVAEILRYCLRYGRLNLDWARSFLTAADYPQPEPLLEALFGRATPPGERSTIFISYRRNAQPDEALALHLARALSQSYTLYFNQARATDSAWVERVHNELAASDFVVVLLSEETVKSEVVATELDMLMTLTEGDGRQRTVLPVYIGDHHLLPPPFSTYLSGLRWTGWRDEKDTPRLIAELQQVVLGGKLPLAPPIRPLTQTKQRENPMLASPIPQEQPQSFTTPHPVAPLQESPEGTIPPQSPLYIERESDAIGHAAIGRSGVTITIKGPRQVGKSSLLVRLREAALVLGKRVVYLDFQLFRAAVADENTFFRLFAYWLGEQLGLSDDIERYWRSPLPNPFRCTEYVSRHVLGATADPIVLALDEVDMLFAADFRSDFFGMLRSWHNSRAFDPTWKRLDLALVTSTEPYFFIDHLNQSPFNVGEVIELDMFSRAQVDELNGRYHHPLTAEEVERLHGLLHGHPYLTRRALYLVANGRITSAELFARAADESGPFGDHLRSLALRLHGRDDLRNALSALVHHGQPPDQESYFRLRGAGLVRRDEGSVRPSSKLYAMFLEKLAH